VQEHLRELAMPDAEVAVEVGSGSDDPAGEKVRFLLAANPGSPVLPLNRVASGGELARAMLALRLVLSGVTHAAGGTLVFDEVDAGIGGRAAHAVGEALAALGAHHQVLVVTHLAHVAALADQHVTVTKSVANGVTRAEAVVLDPESRVDEVARMLAGSLTDSARDHARELLG
jgi:DNA repair protein RecN (Recombination protein N)